MDYLYNLFLSVPIDHQYLELFARRLFKFATISTEKN